MPDREKQEEEAKRDRHLDSRERFRMLQQMAVWLDSQQPVPRISKQGCLANQARLLAAMKLKDQPPAPQ